METEREDAKDAVEKVLKALGSAEVPEGLEARVAARLAQGTGLQPQALVRGTEFRWRDVVAGSAVAGVWWRGAVCGVAASILVIGVVMLAGRLVRVSEQRSGTAVRNVVPAVEPVGAEVVAMREDRSGNCAGSGVLRVAEGGVAQRHDGVRVAIAGVSQVMGGPPLTAEERSLVRLAKNRDLNELASLNPEIRERLEAEDAAQFQRFFAEPMKPVAPAATESVVTTEAATGSIAADAAVTEAAPSVEPTMTTPPTTTTGSTVVPEATPGEK
jgi:hypothetical protein